MLPARKHCSKCGCWRLAVDFMPQRGGLSSQCRTCHRLRMRGDGRARVPGYCRNGHRLLPETSYTYPDGKRRCNICRRKVEARWRQENRSTLYEYQRIRAEAKRREAGVVARNLTRSTPGPARQVSAAPFAEWLLAHAAAHDSKSQMSIALGMDDSHADKIIRGEQEKVSIDIVDRALVAAGEQHLLNEWYPVEVPA